MQSSNLSSKIRESAAGLAKDIFPNSINGYGALETTNELATLRSSHKLSSAPSLGTSSSPQLAQTLSKRHHAGSESLRCPDFYYTALDAGGELSDFLLQECDMVGANVSISQSESALDLALASGSNIERESRDHLKRNDSFEPELSRSKQKSPARSWHVDTELSRQTFIYNHSVPESFDSEVTSDWSISTTREDRNQELSLEHHSKATAENAPDMVSARRKEKALSRLHLIFSQMPAAIQSLGAAESRQTDLLESSYNQLCGGDDAQEWAEFEASLFRTYSGQSQAMGQDLKQTQQHEQSTSIIAGRQAPLEFRSSEGSVLQNLNPSIEDFMRQDQALNKDEEQAKTKGPLDEFNCPWIACHSVRVLPIEAVGDCSLTRCTEIPGLCRLHSRYR